MLALLTLLVLQASPPAPVVPPGITQVVEAFFAAQQAEDADAYLTLWSTTAKRPLPVQLKYIFDSGDDRFSGLTITHAALTDRTARVRVSVMRERTDVNKRPDGTARVFTTPLTLAITLVLEEGAWKITREGSPVDELGEALAGAGDPSVRKGLLEAEPDLVNTRLVESLARRADALAQRNDYRGARVLYERSLEVARAIGDRKAEGQALGNLATSDYYLREFDRSRALHEERLALDRAAGNEAGVSSALVGIATILYTTAEYGAAMRLYLEALEIQERLDDQVLVANTLISTGNIRYLQGDFIPAIADYTRAEQLKRQFHDLAGAWMALEGRGRTQAAQGDLTAALTSFTTVLDERRRLKAGGAPMAFTLRSIGEIHFRLGNTDPARTALDEGRALFEAAGDRGSVGRILQVSAVNELVAGRPAAAEKAYAASIVACGAATEAECAAAAQVGLGFTLAAQSKYTEAIQSYRTGIGGFTRLQLREPAGRARLGLAEAFIGQQDYEAANREAIEARHTAVAIGSDDLLWRALVSTARAERKLGKSADARGSARAALATLRAMSQAALKRPGRALPRDASSAYATMAILEAEAGDAAAAFTAAEEMRGVVLRAALAPHEREISRGMTHGEQESERLISVELVSLHAQLERERTMAKPDQRRIEQLTASIAQAETRRTALLEGIFTRQPGLRTWRGLDPIAAPDVLERFVDSETTAWLAFVVDERDLLVLYASRLDKTSPVTIEAHVVPIARTELAERIARTLSTTALTSVTEWRKSSPALFDLIPGSVIVKLPVLSRLYVSPDDVLWRVPFEVMTAGPGYLGERVAVSYVPSLTAIAAPVSAPGTPSGPAVVVTRPQLSATTIDRLKMTAPGWRLTADPAPKTPDLASGEWNGQAPVRIEGAGATAAAVADRLPSAGLVHIEAPFRVNAPSPLFSPILLAPRGDDGLDEHLEVRQIFNRSSTAPVVVFTDPAALSMRDAGAALTSIYWAWRAAGVRTIVMPRWGGTGDAALDTLRKVYEGVREGHSPTASLLQVRKAPHQDSPTPAAFAVWLMIGEK